MGGDMHISHDQRSQQLHTICHKFMQLSLLSTHVIERQFSKVQKLITNNKHINSLQLS